MEYRHITGKEQLTELDDLSRSGEGVLIFKHSTRCGISNLVWNRFRSSWEEKEELPLYYLDLLNFREASNEVARRYGIEHQSPQLLLIRDGNCVYSASHSEIASENLKRYMNE